MTDTLNRDQIRDRFEEWLDRAMSPEDPPRGLDAEILSALTDGGIDEARRCDSYALWAAMTALTQEVKLQGRAFKDLNDTVGSQASRIADELRVSYKEREREVQREAERRARKEILSALIDLRDRLSRGLESMAASRTIPSKQSWLARLVSKPDNSAAEALAALTKGYELGLERLDQTLENFNAREIRCLGQPFDPKRMNAVDKQESADVKEGTVLEVYRSGYEWNGEVFRPAQVKVACAPGPAKSHE